MTCQECIEVLFEDEALFEGSGGEVGREALIHLGECEDCRTLAREIQTNATALREMRDDALPEIPARPVVLTSASNKRWSASRYLYPLAAAAALVAAIGLSVWRSNNLPTEVAGVVIPSSRPEVAAVLPTAVDGIRRTNGPQVASRALRPANLTSRDASNQRRQGAEFRSAANITAQAAPPTRPEPMKILTADPNVVIYLVLGESSVQADSEGEIL
ncbi:MAG: hypothetical protein ABI824_04235 [Acidobacteriota bacterium]